MSKHYLVFINGAWHRTNRLPTKKYAPPEPWQVKWLIQGWEDEYCVCTRRLLWRMPHVNAQGRRKGWRQILLIEKHEGYKGFNFWRDGTRYYYSVRQLRQMLVRQPVGETSAGQ